ncbi:hypothetical protein [Streptomyces sp. NPDC054786]
MTAPQYSGPPPPPADHWDPAPLHDDPSAPGVGAFAARLRALAPLPGAAAVALTAAHQPPQLPRASATSASTGIGHRSSRPHREPNRRPAPTPRAHALGEPATRPRRTPPASRTP